MTEMKTEMRHSTEIESMLVEMYETDVRKMYAEFKAQQEEEEEAMRIMEAEERVENLRISRLSEYEKYLEGRN
jgi:hypothetical protein